MYSGPRVVGPEGFPAVLTARVPLEWGEGINEERLKVRAPAGEHVSFWEVSWDCVLCCIPKAPRYSWYQ